MEKQEIRDKLSDGRDPVSFVSYVSGVDSNAISEFIAGNDDAMSSSDVVSLEKLYCVPESEQAKNLQANRAILEGLIPSLGRHTIGFLYEGANGKLGIGTGVLVRLGNRLFICTAGHLIRPRKTMQFIGENSGFVECSIVDSELSDVHGGWNISPIGSGKHGDIDVGFIELGPDAITDLGREPIGIDRIHADTGQFGRNVFLHGFSSELCQPIIDSPGNGRLPMGSVTHGTPLFAPDEWPTVPDGDRLGDADIDCFVRFAISDRMFTVCSSYRSRTIAQISPQQHLPKAPGMSGGGLWQSWAAQDGLWNPQDYKLIAIQSKWSEERKYARAIQIRHWLRG